VIGLEYYNGSWTSLTITDGTTPGQGLDYAYDTVIANHDEWTGNGSDTIEVSSGLVYNQTNASDGDEVSLIHNIVCTGDFDIYIPFSNLSWAQPSAANNYFGLYFKIDSNNYGYIWRRYQTGGTNEYYCEIVAGGSSEGTDTDTTTDTSGNLRIARSSDTITFYYGTPGSWTTLHSFASQTTDPVYFYHYWNIGDKSELTSLTLGDIVATTTTETGPSFYQTGDIEWICVQGKVSRR